MMHRLCHKIAGRVERVPFLSVKIHMQKVHKYISKGTLIIPLNLNYLYASNDLVPYSLIFVGLITQNINNKN